MKSFQIINTNPCNVHPNPNPNAINMKSLSYDITDTSERSRIEKDYGLLLLRKKVLVVSVWGWPVLAMLQTASLVNWRPPVGVNIGVNGCMSVMRCVCAGML